MVPLPDRIKVHIFHTGKVRVDRAIPYREKNPLAVTGFFRGEEKKLDLPVSCYLVEHPRGRLLFDTGWDSRYVHEKPHRFFGLLDQVSTPILREGESIDCQLAGLGLRPEDIDCILFSHMDFDHTSGLRLVQKAKRIMAAAEELADAEKYFFRYVPTNWDFARVEPFRYEATGLGPVGKSYDVFGDGTVVLVNTPGHTHGLFSAVIRRGKSYVVLAGDTVYTRRSWEERILPGFTVDKALARRSLDWICACGADPDCLGVYANHDPEVTPGVIEL